MHIVIVDDDKLVSSSLKMILEAETGLEVVGIGSNGQEAIELYRALKPDILLMDIRMDGMSGLEAGAKIIEEDQQAKILFLTTFSDNEYIVKAFQIGAKGYILKQNYESLIPSLKAVYLGQRVLGRRLSRRFQLYMVIACENPI